MNNYNKYLLCISIVSFALSYAFSLFLGMSRVEISNLNYEITSQHIQILQLQDLAKTSIERYISLENKTTGE